MKDVIYVHKYKLTGNHKRRESSQISKVHNFIILGVLDLSGNAEESDLREMERGGKEMTKEMVKSEKFLPDFSWFQ